MISRMNRLERKVNRVSVPLSLGIVFTLVGLACLGCYFLYSVLQMRYSLTLGWEGNRYLWEGGPMGTVRWDVDRRVVDKRTFQPAGILNFVNTKDGDLWAYYEGVWQLESGKWIERQRSAGLPRGMVYDLIETEDGTIWAATDQGFVSWDKQTETWQASPVDLPAWRMIEGRDGSLWFGLIYDGVMRLHSGHLTHWTVDDGLNDNRIRSILEANDGTIWVGTNQGINHWNGNDWKAWPGQGYLGFEDCLDPDGLVVYHLLQASDGIIWADTSACFASWDGESWTASSDSPHCFNAFSFLETTDGSLWAGCPSGVYRWIGSRWSRYGQADGLSDVSGARLIEGANGILYAKDRNRIYQYEPVSDRWLPFP